MAGKDYKDIKNVAKGAGISLLGMFAGRGLWFLCQVLIARLFGVEVFGIYILGVTTLKITELFARFGLHTGAMRFISIYRRENHEKLKGVLITSISASLLNGIVLGTLLYFLSGIISESVFHKPELKDVIKTFALAVPFMASMMVIATASQGFHTAKYAVYTRDIIQPSTNILLIFIFIYFGFGLLGVIYAFILSHFVAFISGAFFITKIFPGIKDKTLSPVYITKELITYSAPLVFVGFLHFLLSWTDTIMLGIMKTSQDVGIYKAATQMPLLLIVVLNASNSIYAPIIADLFYKGDKKRMESILKTTTRWIYLLVLPASLILIFSAEEVMSIFGPGFVEKGIPVLIILTIAQFINCLTGGVGFTLTMTGRQKLEMLNSLALVVINIILNLFLIPKYSALGAAIATATSIILINLIRLVEVFILYMMSPFSISYIKTFIPIVIAVSFMLSGQQLSLQPVWNTMLNILIVVLSFSLYIRFVGFDEEERYILSLVKQKVINIFKIQGGL